MSDRFNLLRSKEFKATRQATLRGTIDWSWELLTRWEKSALAQISVFEGGFDLEAIEHVVSFEGLADAPWAVDIVQGLVEQSLVRPIGDDRFDLLVSVREYAAEKLVGLQDPDAVRIRHAGYFATFGTDEAVEAIYRHGGLCVSDTLILEFDNLRAALLHAVAARKQSLALSCLRAVLSVIERRGPYDDAYELTSHVLVELPLTRLARGECLLLQGHIDRLSGHSDRAKRFLTEAVAIGRDIGDAKLEVRGLRSLAWVLFYNDETDAANDIWQRTEALARDNELHTDLTVSLVERSDVLSHRVRPRLECSC